MHVSGCNSCVAVRLELIRDIAVQKGVVESRKRKEYDHGKVKRELKIGEKIWCRIPGKNGKNRKLEDSWEGPYIVEKMLSK